MQDVDRLRRIVSARAFAALDPLQEFQLEASATFAQLLLGEAAPGVFPACPSFACCCVGLLNPQLPAGCCSTVLFENFCFAGLSMMAVARCCRCRLCWAAARLPPTPPPPRAPAAADFKQRAAMDAFCHVSLTQVAAASRQELTAGRAVVLNRDSAQAGEAAAADGADEAGSSSSVGGAGAASQRELEAEGFAILLDRRPELAQHIQEESRAVAARRHAAAAAERAAVLAQAESAEALGQRLQGALGQTARAAGGAMQAAKAAAGELEAAARQLPLDAPAPACREARRRSRQAEAAVVDMYLAALECMEKPALAAAQANAEFDAAAAAINAAAEADDAAGRVAALLRMRAAADAADRAAQDAAAWCMRAQQLGQTSFEPRLREVQAAVQAARDGGNVSGSDSGSDSNVDAPTSPSLAEVRGRILAAMERIRQLNQDAPAPAQSPAATPVGFALGAVLQALGSSAAQPRGGLADTPSAVHVPPGAASSGGGTPQQQSSAAIDQYLVQLAAAALQQRSSGDEGSSAPQSETPSAIADGSESGEDSYGRVSGAVWGSRSTRDALRRLGAAPQQSGDGDSSRPESRDE